MKINVELHAKYKAMQRLAMRMLFNYSNTSKLNRSLLLDKASYYMVKSNSLVID